MISLEYEEKVKIAAGVLRFGKRMLRALDDSWSTVIAESVNGDVLVVVARAESAEKIAEFLVDADIATPHLLTDEAIAKAKASLAAKALAKGTS